MDIKDFLVALINDASIDELKSILKGANGGQAAQHAAEEASSSDASDDSSTDASASSDHPGTQNSSEDSGGAENESSNSHPFDLSDLSKTPDSAAGASEPPAERQVNSQEFTDASAADSADHPEDDSAAASSEPDPAPSCEKCEGADSTSGAASPQSPASESAPAADAATDADTGSGQEVSPEDAAEAGQDQSPAAGSASPSSSAASGDTAVPQNNPQKITRETVISAYKEYLDKRNLSYTYNGTSGELSMDFKLKNKLKETTVKILFPATDRGCCHVRAYLNQVVPPSCRVRVLEFIAERNIGFVFGRFLFDSRRLAYEYVGEYKELSEITDKFISRSVMIPLESMESTGDALADILAEAAPEGGKDGSGSSEDSEEKPASEDKNATAYLSTEDVVKLFCSVMTEMGFKFSVERDKGNVVLSASFRLDSPIGAATLFVNFYKDGYMIRFEAEPRTPEENRVKMSEALNLWNYNGFSVGNCEMCPADGRLFYKYYVICGKITDLPGSVIAHSIRYALDSFDDMPQEVSNLLLGIKENEEKEQDSGKLIEFPTGRRPEKDKEI